MGIYNLRVMTEHRIIWLGLLAAGDYQTRVLNFMKIDA